MYYINFDNTKNLSILPKSIITKDICDEYFDYTKNTKNIPIEFLNLNNYINKQENYISLRNTILNKNDINFILDNFTKIKSNTLIKVINENIINRSFCYKYFEEYKDIEYIPKEYITKSMINIYFEKYKDIKYIPVEFLNSEICNKYFKIHCNTKYIPDNLVTEYMKEIIEDFEIKGDNENEK